MVPQGLPWESSVGKSCTPEQGFLVICIEWTWLHSKYVHKFLVIMLRWLSSVDLGTCSKSTRATCLVGKINNTLWEKNSVIKSINMPKWIKSKNMAIHNVQGCAYVLIDMFCIFWKVPHIWACVWWSVKSSVDQVFTGCVKFFLLECSI